MSWCVKPGIDPRRSRFRHAHAIAATREFLGMDLRRTIFTRRRAPRRESDAGCGRARHQAQFALSSAACARQTPAVIPFSS
jgi:hypothetical protein